MVDAMIAADERLGGVEREVAALRLELRTEIGTIRSAIDNLRSEMKTQFYWTLTFILGAILIPILRDLAVVR
jgi:hypothetical protein